MVALGDDCGFAEGPAQVGIAQLGAAQTFDLAGAGDGAFDQAAIGDEVFDGGEAVDVADLIENGQAEAFTNAGHRLEQCVIAGQGQVFGQMLEFDFDDRDLAVKGADHGQVVSESELALGVIFGRQESFFPSVAGAAGLLGGSAVMSQLVGVNAGQQFGAAPDVVDALAQEGTQRPLLGRIYIRWRDEIGAQQVGELLGVDAVVFVFSPVDGFDVEGVGQDELEAGVLASVGQPIPTEHALATDGQVVFVRLDELEEELEVVVFDVAVDQLFAFAVHDADVHLTGMQIDSAVVLGGGGVILHSV